MYEEQSCQLMNTQVHFDLPELGTSGRDFESLLSIVAEDTRKDLDNESSDYLQSSLDI
jgi:hypothetical protein